MRSRFLFICFFQKKIFFQTEISLYKVLRSATVSRSRVKTFPLRQNSTLWHPNPVGERSAGDTMGLGTSNGRLAVGVRSLLKRLLGRPAVGIFLRESHMLKPKKLTTHRHDQLEDSHLDMCWTLWWTASSFNKKLQSFLRLEKNNNKNELLKKLSKILRSLPLVAVPFIAGNAPQLLGRATEVLRELRQKNVWPSHDWRINLSKKRVFLPKSGDHQLIW